MTEYQERIKHLEEAHHALEKQLGKMQKHPHVDETKVAELKKKKLSMTTKTKIMFHNHRNLNKLLSLYYNQVLIRNKTIL